MEGHSKLWGWWGLDRASFLTMPRILMHAMPDDWQRRMAELLEEYDAAYPNRPNIGTVVQATKDGKFTKFPAWLLNYRHPDQAEIDKLRN